MPGGETGSPEDAQGRQAHALALAGVVGTWEWDHRRKVARYSPGAAELLSGDPALAGRDLTAEEALQGVYVDDVAWLREQMRIAAHVPGVMVREHRVHSERLGTRRVLCRGRTYHDANGEPACSVGIIIDITDIEADGRSRFAPGADDAMDSAIAYGLATYDAIQATGRTGLLEPARALLVAIGRDIAAGVARRRAGLH